LGKGGHKKKEKEKETFSTTLTPFQQQYLRDLFNSYFDGFKAIDNHELAKFKTSKDYSSFVQKESLDPSVLQEYLRKKKDRWNDTHSDLFFFFFLTSLFHLLLENIKSSSYREDFFKPKSYPYRL